MKLKKYEIFLFLAFLVYGIIMVAFTFAALFTMIDPQAALFMQTTPFIVMGVVLMGAVALIL